MAKVLLGRGFSMKYKLYRSFGNLDKDVRRHELVAVEYGTNLEAVTDAIIHAVSDDLAGTPEYCELLKPLLLHQLQSRSFVVFGGTTMK